MTALDWQSAIDIGFVMLVIASSWQSLFGSQSDANRKVWRRELAELEVSLRQLIGEAGQASIALDQRLQTRRHELEAVVAKAERLSRSISSEKKKADAAPRSKRVADDLPNETWRERPKFKSSASSDEETGLLVDVGPAQKQPDALDELEALLEQASDTIELTSAPTAELPPAFSRRPADEPESDERLPLSEQIEVVRADADIDDADREPLILDPVAYKVARRLLSNGQEIHVVARKLEIPLSEIRLLDRIMRRELAQSRRTGHEPLRATYDVEAAPTPAKRRSANKRTNRKKGVDSAAFQAVDEILAGDENDERELVAI